MAKSLPGWVLYSQAERTIRQAGLWHTGWRLLRSVSKRRFPTRPGKRRRKYWFIKQQDFDRLVLEAKAIAVAAVLNAPVPSYAGRW